MRTIRSMEIETRGTTLVPLDLFEEGSLVSTALVIQNKDDQLISVEGTTKDTCKYVPLKMYNRMTGSYLDSSAQEGIFDVTVLGLTSVNITIIGDGQVSIKVLGEQ